MRLLCLGGCARGRSAISWMLDEGGVVGDNNLDWVTPVSWGSAVGSVLEGRPARMLAGMFPVAGADNRESTDVSVGRSRS